MISPKTRLLIVAPLVALALSTVAACSNENASTDCSLNSCTVTFNRGVDAKASFLGVDAELVTATDNSVTVKIAGQQLNIPLSENETSGNFDVRVKSITQDNVVLEIKQN